MKKADEEVGTLAFNVKIGLQLLAAFIGGGAVLVGVIFGFAWLALILHPAAVFVLLIVLFAALLFAVPFFATWMAFGVLCRKPSLPRVPVSGPSPEVQKGAD